MNKLMTSKGSWNIVLYSALKSCGLETNSVTFLFVGLVTQATSPFNINENKSVKNVSSKNETVIIKLWEQVGLCEWAISCRNLWPYWPYQTKILPTSVNTTHSQDTNTDSIKTFSTLFPANHVVQSSWCFFETEHWTLWFKLWGINIPATLVPAYYCAIKIEVETSNFPLRPSLEWRRHDS